MKNGSYRRSVQVVAVGIGRAIRSGFQPGWARNGLLLVYQHNLMRLAKMLRQALLIVLNGEAVAEIVVAAAKCNGNFRNKSESIGDFLALFKKVRQYPQPAKAVEGHADQDNADNDLAQHSAKLKQKRDSQKSTSL